MITASDYRNLKNRCLKRVWLEKNNKSIVEKKDNDKLEETIAIRSLARKLKDGGSLIEYNNSKEVMVHKTEVAIRENKIIYDAMFKYEDVYIKCDILEIDEDKFNIYIIKSKTKVEEKYYDELAIQCYVLEKLGYNVENVNIIYINNKYIRESELDINKLFNIENATEQVKNLVNEVSENVNLIKDAIKENIEPNIDISEYCLKEKGSKDASDCECRKYCFKHIPENSIFDISGTYLKTPTKFKFYKDNIIEFKDLINVKKLSDHAKKQVECELKGTKIVNKEEISKFINELKYPLYFLDFETFMSVIPLYEGTKPYQQIPFQYSLHYKETEEAELNHYEYLAKENENCTREFAKKLIEDLGKNGSIVVYNKKFECSRISELADMYVDLSKDLLKLNERIVDLMDIFSKKHYYQKEMKGSFSIKYVLPSLFPNDEELDYNKLNIQNGSMAMNVFPKLHLKEKEEIKQIREDLLKYGQLDTL